MKEKKKIESPVAKKKDGLKKDGAGSSPSLRDGAGSNPSLRTHSRDSASSVERRTESRLTRSKAENISPKPKAKVPSFHLI